MGRSVLKQYPICGVRGRPRSTAVTLSVVDGWSNGYEAFVECKECGIKIDKSRYIVAQKKEDSKEENNIRINGLAIAALDEAIAIWNTRN